MSPAASSLSLPLLVFGSIAVQSSLDTDRDGVPDALDNCPSTFNPDQHDVDGDGLGLSCDTNLDPRIWLRSSPHRRPFPRPRRLAD